MYGSKTTAVKPQRAQSSRDELINNRYNLSEPEGVYPLDGSHSGINKYPDFQPWKHTVKEDHIAVDHLQRGYFESPQVGNELLSARNIMHQLLRSKNSLESLSSNVLMAMDLRARNNRVGPGTYKPPPRVTLTDQKRENWLKDLANSEVPLRKLARTIPHGVRNKTLIEQCVSKKIPITRAIWFVRCVSTNELRGLKRKGGANIEYTWVQEWTTQVLEFIEKLSHDYLKFESFQQAKESWKTNVSYLLRFVSNLYIENLVDKDSIKFWILKFFKLCKIYELPLALTIIKMFWNEISKTDYIIKEITETIILRYSLVSSCKNLLEAKDIIITDQQLNDNIKLKIMKELKFLLMNSFSQSIDNFILPNNWDQLSPIIGDILDLTDSKTKKKFDIINYRNESLMINYSLNKNREVRDVISVLDKLEGEIDYDNIISLILKDDWKFNVKLVLQWSLTRFRYKTSRVYLFTELCKRLKTHPSVPLKALEQEILESVFSLSLNPTDLILDDLFLLLNQLIQIKVFKVPIYLRRLISSGLIYQNDNHLEKQVHASILMNLKPQKGSQTSLILKNLSEFNGEGMDYDEMIKLGLSILHDNSDRTLENLHFLKNMPVGVKLQLSELYLSKILERENLFPLITYTELRKMLETLLSLGDMNSVTRLIVKALDSQNLEREEFLLLTECILTNLQLVSFIVNIDDIVLSILQNANRLMLSTSMIKFWQAFNKSFKSKYSDDIEKNINQKGVEYDLATIMMAISESELDITYDQLIQESSFHNNFQVLIRSLFNNNSCDSKGKAIIILMKVLKFHNTAEFNRIVFVHIKKTYSSSTELLKYEPLWDIIIYDLVSVQMIVETFLSFNSQIHLSFILDLLFKESTPSEPHDFFKLSLLREQFKRENPKTMINLIKMSLSESDIKMESIQSDSADIINTIMDNTTSSTYKSEQLAVFLDILISDQKMVVAAIENEDDALKNKIIMWLNETIFNRPEDIAVDYVCASRLVENIKRENRFNLPLMQLLFKLELNQNIPEDDLVTVLKAVILRSTKEKTLSFIFELLDVPLKIKLIHFLEMIFLSSPSFPSVNINDQQLDLTCLSDSLVALSSGTQNVTLSDELIFSLDVSLDHLNKVIAQGDRDVQVLYSAISLFLKIIIIHKGFLINILIERNTIKESFLNNLVNLLSTNVVSSNLKLKNLLYDLILSIKSSINEINSSQVHNVKLPVSIINLPSISSNAGKSKAALVNKQNLHDFNCVLDLYLYHKTTCSFHEFNIKPFDMVEDSNPIENLNDTAVSLQLFEASIERKNPT